MLKKLFLSFAILSFCQPAHSLTRLDQNVTILNYHQGKEKIYTKPFSDLKLDKSTMQFILDKNEALDKTSTDNYYLGFIRLDDDLVTKVMFLGEKGNVASFEVRGDNKKACYLSLTESSMGGCRS